MNNQPQAELIEILMVDDNPGDIEITRKSLKEGKIRNVFNSVKDGEEAMDYLYQRGRFANAARPDLILLDLNMPKKDGREVLEEIKTDPNLKSIPVVILTSSKAESDIVDSYNMNANCYVPKPVELETFIGIVKKIEEFWLDVVKLPTSIQ